MSNAIKKKQKSSNSSVSCDARIISVQDGLVKIKSEANTKNYKPLTKNEVIYISPASRQNSNVDERIMSEVLRVKNDTAEAQVFESTSGISIGDKVEQSNELLSVALSPGLLGMVYDGLQNPLYDLSKEHGYFLPRGVKMSPYNKTNKWAFTPSAKIGDHLHAGDVLGTVQEGNFIHKIMVPFGFNGVFTLDSIKKGNFTLEETIAVLKSENGKVEKISMVQRWPVRKPLSEKLLNNSYSSREYPNEPMITTVRMIDTFFPIALGGTACIPGPFGAGKTVLQSLISRYSNADIVIVVACGERAGEVVEVIKEFPEATDPKTGGSLMDRTIIICNTSSMPVAAREASIYTGITLAEYYRQMGYNTLLIADSTSRWAQAMRETSGRMEEIPGEEGFPAYLDSSIRNIYERAGVIRTNDGSKGSLTMVGTVSPAGGNFEEPVTQSTLNTVKTFLGLSYERAYKRFYPAIDPLISWTRYLEQLHDWFEDNMEIGWVKKVEEITSLLHKGNDISQMMQVTGEEGVTMEDFITYQKSLLFDVVYLQQDAFDPVDISVSIDRQKENFNLIYAFIQKEFSFKEKKEAYDYFTELTSFFKNLNYSKENTTEYKKYIKSITNFLSQ